MSSTMSEAALIIGCAALILNFLVTWTYKAMHAHQQQEMKKLLMRVNYLEVSLHYHELIPLPREMEEIEKRETSNFKQEGNVIYLKK